VKKKQKWILLYLVHILLFIVGIIIDPILATSAKAVPEIPAKIIEDTILDIPKPP